jgi:hypothetical protein
VEWPVAAGGNGHFYEYVRAPGTWTNARAAAAGRTHLGLPGYLATIACPAENDFVTALRGGGDIRAWIGYTDESSEGSFQWVTGEGYSYSNWNGGEPNNTAGIEHYTELFASGAWNDTRNNEPLNLGYVVEHSRATVVEWSVASGGNGHFYEYVRGNTTWNNANAAAQGSSFCGLTGHLVTIASAAENAFVVSLGGGGDLRPWIGLTDAAAEGDYQWVTGEPLCFTNWSPGEPNDFGGVEEFIEMFGNGAWNDNTDFTTFNQGYVVEYEAPLADPTVFRYSFDAATPLPVVPDQGPAGNNATAGPAAMLSADIPPESTFGAGDRSLDCRVNGAVTDATLLLSNAAIAAGGGFTMEAWFKWNGGGTVNSIIDYAGTEKLVIDLRAGGPPAVAIRFNDTVAFPIGFAIPGRWQYVAAVFQACPNPDGTVTGTLTTYLDCLLAPTSVTPGVTKDGFGDSLGRGVGVGQHPLGFALDFFDGLIFEPRVSLRALDPSELLLRIQPTCNGRCLAFGGEISPLPAPATVSGSVSPTTGVYYSFTLAAESDCTFTTCSNGGGADYDTWLCLLAENGATLAFNDDADGCGLQSQLMVVLAPGTYGIAVSGFDNRSGNYTLAYSCTSLAPVGTFLRCDSNCSGAVDISDAVHTLNFLFLGGMAPCCPAAADCNGSGVVDISDPTYGLNFLFLGGPMPPAPFPTCGGTGCPNHPCP